MVKTEEHTTNHSPLLHPAMLQTTHHLTDKQTTKSNPAVPDTCIAVTSLSSVTNLRN
jgi:hypothetical protein